MRKRQLRKEKMRKNRKGKVEEEKNPNVIYAVKITQITSAKKNCPK